MVKFNQSTVLFNIGNSFEANLKTLGARLKEKNSEPATPESIKPRRKFKILTLEVQR